MGIQQGLPVSTEGSGMYGDALQQTGVAGYQGDGATTLSGKVRNTPVVALGKSDITFQNSRAILSDEEQMAVGLPFIPGWGGQATVGLTESQLWSADKTVTSFASNQFTLNNHGGHDGMPIVIVSGSTVLGTPQGFAAPKDTDEVRSTAAGQVFYMGQTTTNAFYLYHSATGACRANLPGATVTYGQFSFSSFTTQITYRPALKAGFLLWAPASNTASIFVGRKTGIATNTATAVAVVPGGAPVFIPVLDVRNLYAISGMASQTLCFQTS